MIQFAPATRRYEPCRSDTRVAALEVGIEIKVKTKRYGRRIEGRVRAGRPPIDLSGSGVALFIGGGANSRGTPRSVRFPAIRSSEKWLTGSRAAKRNVISPKRDRIGIESPLK